MRIKFCEDYSTDVETQLLSKFILEYRQKWASGKGKSIFQQKKNLLGSIIIVFVLLLKKLFQSEFEDLLKISVSAVMNQTQKTCRLTYGKN